MTTVEKIKDAAVFEFRRKNNKKSLNGKAISMQKNWPVNCSE